MPAMDVDVVTRLLAAIEAGTGVPAELYAPDAVLDATVPMWRFQVHGPVAIADQLTDWFDAPATFVELERAALPDGESIRITLEWTTDDAPLVSHQAHFVVTDGRRITAQAAWCGGRWDEALQERMGPGVRGRGPAAS